MSNTYFEMQIESKIGMEHNHVARDISLTAFVGGTKSVQMTIATRREHVVALLSDEEAMRLVGALCERIYGRITATGSESSNFTDEEE